MYYTVESDKSFYEACFDLPPVVQRLGFVVLQTQDLSETLRWKEIALDEECQIFDVCNYRLMEKLLAIDMKFSLHAPWRISVYTENGATRIGILLPAELSVVSEALNSKVDDRLQPLLREIQEKLTQIVDAVRKD